jgi:glutamine amidotransferase
MKVAIINYGMGNLNSVRRAFEEIGAEVIIANHPSHLYEADRIVLPGVGAFSDGMMHLSQGAWIPALRDTVILRNKPLLGICLGMQMLASVGYEGDEAGGLGFIPGEVKRIDLLGCDQRIPHMGWNEVRYKSNDPIFANISENSDFYFVHSYAFVPSNSENLIALVDYGCQFTAVVRHKNVLGCQFHPEKSSKVGREFLKNFMSYSAC